MYCIRVRIENEPEIVLSDVPPNLTLLEALLAASVPVPHLCGGVCHCTTCHLYVDDGSEHVNEPHSRELAFLKKVKLRRETSRLSCQCLLQEGEGKLTVTLPKVISG